MLPDLKRKSVKTPEPGVKEVNRKRKGLSLASLLKNKVISASAAKPVDPNSMEGQRELIARRDRDLKTVAKQNCIERFNTVDAHLTHWGVSKLCFPHLKILKYYLIEYLALFRKRNFGN